ncbi:MAG: DNA repair protein RecO [bacterium]
MGYFDARGIILHRRNLFENDQEVILLTERGGLAVRAPHARGSQKTYCGRLEAPNRVHMRLYRARPDSFWTLTSVELENVYSELLHRDDLRYHLWPLLSLFRDLFPEGEKPGSCLPRLVKAFDYLQKEYFPPELVVDRLLINIARETGIAHSLQQCSSCGAESSKKWRLFPETGLLCHKCSPMLSEREYPVSDSVVELYRKLFNLSWADVVSCSFNPETLVELEQLMYRFFHYHFDISLKTLKIRNLL